MATLDPSQAFGNLTAGPMKAPTPAQLSPTESVQTASLIGQAHAAVAESGAQLLQSVDKAMTFAQLQAAQTDKATVERIRAEKEMELEKQQAESGVRWSAEEYGNKYRQMLQDTHTEVFSKRSYGFIQDDIDRDKELWLEKSMEDVTRRIIKPRIAQDIAVDINNQSAEHTSTAITKAQSGDFDGAITALGQAADVYDQPQAAIAIDDPLKRQQLKQAALKQGLGRVLALMEPNRAKEFLDNQVNLMANGQQVHPAFASLNESEILGLRDTFIEASAAQTKLANAKNKDLAVQQLTVMESEARAQMAHAEANDDLKTFTGMELQYKSEIAKLSDPALASDPASQERLKVVVGLYNHLNTSRQQMLDRAERRAQHNETLRVKQREKEEKFVEETREVRDSLATGIPIDVNSSSSRNGAQKYYEKEIAPQADKNPAVVTDFIAKTGYVPQHVSNRIARDVMSDDPQVVTRGLDTMNQVIALNPNAVKTLPKGTEDILTDHQRGLTPQEIIEQRKRTLAMSDQQKTIVKQAGGTQFSQTFGNTYSKQASGVVTAIKDVTGVELDATPQVVEKYKDAYVAEYIRTQDASSAAAVAAKAVTGKRNVVGFGRTDVGGVSKTIEGAPEAMYEFVDGEKQDFDSQVRSGLQSIGLTGHEKYVPVFKGKNKDGQPLYQINTVDEHGQLFPVVNEDGTMMVFQYERYKSTHYANSVVEQNQQAFESSEQGKQYAHQQEMERRQQVKQQIKQRNIEAQKNAPAFGPGKWNSTTYWENN